jgi:hypothetical protein
VLSTDIFNKKQRRKSGKQQLNKRQQKTQQKEKVTMVMSNDILQF